MTALQPREPVYSALFALGASITYAGTPWAFTARKVFLWGDIPSQPAFCQAEPRESTKARTNKPAVRTWTASWLFYFTVDQSDLSPGTKANSILDQVDALMPTFDEGDIPAFGGKQQTLGGLVHRMGVQGETKKFLGDITGQGLIVVPLVMLVP